MTPETDDFAGDATPTQRLASRIEELEADKAEFLRQRRELIADWRGMRKVIQDVKAEFESILLLLQTVQPHGKVTFSVQSRIDMLRLLIGSKDLRDYFDDEQAEKDA